MLCSIMIVGCKKKTSVVTIYETKQPQPSLLLSKENFPDVNFRSAICRLLPIAEGDSIPNEYINRIEELNLAKLGIGNLKGIEFFTSLRQLDCMGNNLTNIDISKNQSLLWLECGDNKLTKIDVSKNSNLIGLGCSNNVLTSIDVTQNPNLQELFCSGNRIERINVAHNPKLHVLGVNDCKLIELDVSGNPELEKLYCNDNKFKKLDLSSNIKLEQLYCEQPLFGRIDITRPANNPKVGMGTTHTWTDYLTLFWSK